MFYYIFDKTRIRNNNAKIALINKVVVVKNVFLPNFQ
jgi:hypothetical protein